MIQSIENSPYRHETFTATNDYAFKKLFGAEENKDILIEVLSLVTGMDKADFAELSIANTEQPLQFFDDKASRLDIKITLNDGKKIDVEMQNLWFDYYANRSIYYWAQLFTESLKRGDDYYALKKCIAINILNAPFKLSEKIQAIYRIFETETHTLLSDVLEIHFLDLTKLPKEEGNALEKWLKFIKTDKQEERAMLSRNNVLMEKANRVMDEFYIFEQERERYLAACRYESDRVSMINESERKGFAKGIEKGLAKGFSDGAYQTKLATARLMKQAHCEADFIIRMTGLSAAEIEKL